MLNVEIETVEIETPEHKKYKAKRISRDYVTQRNLTQMQVILLHFTFCENAITNKLCRDLYGYCHLPSIVRDLKKFYGCEFGDYMQKGLNRFLQKEEHKTYFLKNREVYKQCL